MDYLSHAMRSRGVWGVANITSQVQYSNIILKSRHMVPNLQHPFQKKAYGAKSFHCPLYSSNTISWCILDSFTVNWIPKFLYTDHRLSSFENGWLGKLGPVLECLCFYYYGLPGNCKKLKTKTECQYNIEKFLIH